jgi:hypothetical protein
MVIHNFHFKSIAALPAKTYPPLVIYAYAEMTLPVAAQGFQAIAMREPEIIQGARIIQEQQLAPGRSLNLRWKSPRRFIVENALGFLAGEAAYHPGDYTATQYGRQHLQMWKPGRRAGSGLGLGNLQGGRRRGSTNGKSAS